MKKEKEMKKTKRKDLEMKTILGKSRQRRRRQVNIEGIDDVRVRVDVRRVEVFRRRAGIVGHISKMQQWIKTRGGATKTPWGKFWLAMLGCYEWKGLNEGPECWLLPYWYNSALPGAYWCHSEWYIYPCPIKKDKMTQI